MSDMLSKLSIQAFITVVLVLAFVAVILLWMLLPLKVDQSVQQLLNLMIGALISSFTTIIGFFFGSSQGSKDKDSARDKLLLKAPTTPEPPKV
jgi:hypothetical protein